MKSIGLTAVLTMLTIAGSAAFAANCDVSKTARQAVKAVVAVEDIKGITAYYGGMTSSDATSTTIAVQPYYATTKDIYNVQVRNVDCRILSTILVQEGVAQ